MIFVVATKNRHKFQEIKGIFSGFQFELASLTDFPPLKFPEETGKTYEKNALRKAEFAAEKLNLPVLADDSGLEIEALPKELGVYSSRFLGEDTSYQIKNHKILEMLKEVPPNKRGAKFVCAAVCAFPDGKSISARGEIAGRIADVAHGAQGFGYDPIFFLPDYGKTMAELSPQEKNRISHRAQAFRNLAAYL